MSYFCHFVPICAAGACVFLIDAGSFAFPVPEQLVRSSIEMAVEKQKEPEEGADDSYDDSLSNVTR